MNFIEYLLNEGANEMEYRRGEVVYLNPSAVGPEGGVGKVVSAMANGNTISVRNVITGKTDHYSLSDVRNSDNVPDEWMTKEVERVHQTI